MNPNPNPDPASLDNLHDIVAPSPVPWWPPAPGWIWLAGVCCVVLLAVAVRLFVRWQAGCYRREALRELRRHRVDLERPERRAAALAGMASLLKRAALTAFPRKEVASLTGSAWLSFLDWTGETLSFTQRGGEWLEKAAYDPRCAGSIDADQARRLTAMTRHWLIHHRIDPAKEGR